MTESKTERGEDTDVERKVTLNKEKNRKMVSEWKANGDGHVERKVKLD